MINTDQVSIVSFIVLISNWSLGAARREDSKYRRKKEKDKTNCVDE